MAVNVSPALLEEADRVPLAVDWEVARRAPLAFACRVIQACRLHPGFRRRGWKPQRTKVAWIRPDGGEMTERDWHGATTLAVLLDDACFLTLHWGPSQAEILMPPAHLGRAWRCICTTTNGFVDGGPARAPREAIAMPPRTIAAFIRDP